MACKIASNNIQSPELRDTVNKAVSDGIGAREGEWSVVIYQAPDYPALAIRIEGPKGLHWSWTFYEREQGADFIQQKVAEGIAAQASSR
jgi:hypothetical protein